MMTKNILMRKSIHIQTIVNYHLGLMNHHLEKNMEIHQKDHQKGHQKNHHHLKITLSKKVMLAGIKGVAAIHAVVTAAAAPVVKSSRRLNAHSRIFVIKFAISKKAKSIKMLALPLSRPDLG